MNENTIPLYLYTCQEAELGVGSQTQTSANIDDLLCGKPHYSPCFETSFGALSPHQSDTRENRLKGT